MPDDQMPLDRNEAAQSLKEFIPPALMAVGVISLLRMSRFLTLVALGALLYEAAATSDGDRKARGRDFASKRKVGDLLDREIEDSFPASDPPSFSGSTAGAP